MDRIEDIETFGVGQVVIEQDDIEPVECAQCFAPGGHVFDRAEARVLDDAGHEPGDRGVVVDQQDARSRG